MEYCERSNAEATCDERWLAATLYKVELMRSAITKRSNDGSVPYSGYGLHDLCTAMLWNIQ